MISENKLKHSLGVARKCEELAKEKGLTKDIQKACFVMGFLHDIGYENGDIDGHPERSFDYVQAFTDFPDASKAIINHGTKYHDLSIFDEIINTADLTVNHEGTPVSVDERLESIKERHGVGSEHYNHALKMAMSLDLI